MYYYCHGTQSKENANSVVFDGSYKLKDCIE